MLLAKDINKKEWQRQRMQKKRMAKIMSTTRITSMHILILSKKY